MKFTSGCWRHRLVVPVVVMNWLTGGAAAGFEAKGVAACPPVVEYSREFQARVGEELLPDRSAVVEMMGSYAVMREQARVCQ